jgi:hypothetical protein
LLSSLRAILLVCMYFLLGVGHGNSLHLHTL